MLIEKHAELDGKMAQIQRWLPGRSYNDVQRLPEALLGSASIESSKNGAYLSAQLADAQVQTVPCIRHLCASRYTQMVLLQCN
jgi:hypothetical protein